MTLRRDHRILAVTAAFAVGVPVAAAAWVGNRTRALADHLGTASGVAAHVGGVDADLTGTIRLTDVALGKLFAAESIEASVALSSLLAGNFSADEIRVSGPRISVEVDRDGDSDLARLVRRLAATSKSRRGGDASKRIRRIVVSSGTLTARIAGLGELSADAVELVPDAGGVRVITGKLTVRGGNADFAGELTLARSSAELSLPRVTFGRVLAVAGTGSLRIADQTVALRDIAIGRLSPGGALEARGFLDDAGIPRAIGVELRPPRDDFGFALTLHGDRVPLAPFASLAPRGVALERARASGKLEVSVAPFAGPRGVARGSGNLDARTSDNVAGNLEVPLANDTVRFSIDGAVTGLGLDHKTIAPQPVSVDATVGATLTVSRDAIAVERAAVAIGAARWTTSGWLRRGSPISGQLDVRLATAPCTDLFAALPVEIRGPLDGLTMTGTFGARARLSIDLAAPAGEGVELDTSLANTCTVTAEPPAADVTTLAKAGDHTLPDGTRIRIDQEGDDYVALRRLPNYVTGAFVSAEDGRFWEHDGFDLQQIARSFEIDLRDRRLARGGSTISQQLIKNAFLTHRRSLDRKVQEAILTWRLETRLEKRTILERYLNIIELGPHIHGIGAAAEYWFDSEPRDLSIRQAAFLAALTSEPASMSRRVRRFGGLDADSAARVDIILRAMRRDGVIDKDELDAAREKPMRFAANALRREI